MTPPPPLPTGRRTQARRRPWLIKLLLLLVRLVCYAALIVVVASFTAMVLLPVAGLCVSNGPGLTCSGDVAQTLADLALSMVLLSVFTGLPLLLAAVGLIYCVFDLCIWLKNRH